MSKNKKRSWHVLVCLMSLVVGAMFVIPVTGQSIESDVPDWDSLRALYGARPEPLTPEQERDEIFTLLAYAVVFKNWQWRTDTGRGYNIGCVLVDSNNTVVYWARNCVTTTGNSTQHGEVRLMNCYMAQTKQRNLKGYTIYTTLEPCAQCSGMMKLASVYRTVYGQTDPGFGKALERLDLNSYAWRPDSGYTPYPRHVISDTLASFERTCLDNYYRVYLDTCKDSSITAFLTSKVAYELYATFMKVFLEGEFEYEDNYKILKQARSFYDSVPDHYVQICPPE